MKANPLRAYRKQHNLSRRDLAEKLDLTPGMVGHIENGIRGISAERAVDIERRIGIPRVLLRPDLFRAA